MTIAVYCGQKAATHTQHFKSEVYFMDRKRAEKEQKYYLKYMKELRLWAYLNNSG